MKSSEIEICVPECAYREKVTELQDENKRLCRGIRRILEIKRLWSSVVGPKYQKMLTEVFSIAKQILE